MHACICSIGNELASVCGQHVKKLSLSLTPKDQALPRVQPMQRHHNKIAIVMSCSSSLELCSPEEAIYDMLKSNDILSE